MEKAMMIGRIFKSRVYLLYCVVKISRSIMFTDASSITIYSGLDEPGYDEQNQCQGEYPVDGDIVTFS